jgi:hypothetical protein
MILSKHLLFFKDGQLPSINLHSLKDDTSNREAGYYFAVENIESSDNARNQIMERLLDSEQWTVMMDYSGDDLQFNPIGIEEYKQWDIKFRKFLFLIGAVSCGLSGRCKEMTAIKYMNTIMGDRGMVVHDGQFMCISEYHKSQAIMDVLKVMYC